MARILPLIASQVLICPEATIIDDKLYYSKALLKKNVENHIMLIIEVNCEAFFSVKR